MENEGQGQKKFEYAGEQVSTDEIDAELERQRKEKEATSKWRAVQPGKTARIGFTGTIYKRMASFEGGESLKYEFETADKVQGQDDFKVFSVGSNTKVARELIRLIKEHKPTRDKPLWAFVTRKGEGKETKYEVSIPEE